MLSVLWSMYLKQRTQLPVVLLTVSGFWSYSKSTLAELGLFFLKAGTFVFGSGLAIVPFLQAGVVGEYHWLNEAQFLDAVAVAMITPPPVGRGAKVILPIDVSPESAKVAVGFGKFVKSGIDDKGAVLCRVLMMLVAELDMFQ